MKSLIDMLAACQSWFIDLLRISIFIVMVWIGGLKALQYEAEGIVPFVANSPFMSFFYNNPMEYKHYQNKEGELVSKNHAWHKSNNTYGFSIALGSILILLGILVASHRFIPLISMLASMLIILMTIGTLSFLVTTHESWVPHSSDRQWGFPFLSSRGRLVVKDIIILGGAVITMSESAALYLFRRLKHKAGPN